MRGVVGSLRPEPTLANMGGFPGTPFPCGAGGHPCTTCTTGHCSPSILIGRLLKRSSSCGTGPPPNGGWSPEASASSIWNGTNRGDRAVRSTKSPRWRAKQSSHWRFRYRCSLATGFGWVRHPSAPRSRERHAEGHSPSGVLGRMVEAEIPAYARRVKKGGFHKANRWKRGLSFLRSEFKDPLPCRALLESPSWKARRPH